MAEVFSPKNYGKHRRGKVEKSCVAFLLCDPGWYVHKPDVQNKWDDNTHTHTYQWNSIEHLPSFSIGQHLEPMTHRQYIRRFHRVHGHPDAMKAVIPTLAHQAANIDEGITRHFKLSRVHNLIGLGRFFC